MLWTHFLIGLFINLATLPGYAFLGLSRYNLVMRPNDSIRTYYDSNTSLFLRFGSSKEIQTIHRALWLEGITSVSDALNAANELILNEAKSMSEPVLIADLGCGVGATLLHLLTCLPPTSRGIGLTLSAVQARLGGKHFQKKNTPGLIAEADFHHLPIKAGFDLAYAIESFVHSFEPERFVAEAARILHAPGVGKSGGRLILIDDFLGKSADGSDKKWLDLYQRGWHIHNLLQPDELALIASRNGLRLVENRLLTPYLRLRVVPDLFARILAIIFRPFWGLHPIVPSMLGSTALQKCLQAGSVEYRWMVFERT